jgi:hypothetical protein
VGLVAVVLIDHRMDWRLSNKFFSVGFELGIEAFRLESFEHFGVGALGLTIAPRVGDGGKTDLDVSRCAVLPEQSAGELAAVVGDDAVRHTKATDQPTDELDCRSGRDCAHWFHLHPLGKLVDGDVEVAVAPLRSGERTKDVQSPNCKRPSEWDGSQLLRRLMNLLGVELARLAPLDHLRRISERQRLVEAASVCLHG